LQNQPKEADKSQKIMLARNLQRAGVLPLIFLKDARTVENT
jgi:hypothetical protein